MPYVFISFSRAKLKFPIFPKKCWGLGLIFKLHSKRIHLEKLCTELHNMHIDHIRICSFYILKYIYVVFLCLSLFVCLFVCTICTIKTHESFDRAQFASNLDEELGGTMEMFFKGVLRGAYGGAAPLDLLATSEIYGFQWFFRPNRKKQILAPWTISLISP